MQPDGTLNPSADPDGAAGPVGLGRVLLAGPHPVGARRGLRRVPRRRPDVRRLPAGPDGPGRRRAEPRRPGPLRARTRSIHGVRVPAWLIVDGADASSEAVARAEPPTCRRPATAPPEPRCAKLADGHRRDVRRVGHRPGRTGRCCPGRCPGPTGTPGARRCPPRSPPQRRRCGDKRLLRAGRRRHRRIHPATADLDRTGQRLAARTGRHHPDRLRRRRPGAGPARRRRRPPAGPGCAQLAGIAAGWFFGQNTAGAADLRPGDRRHQRRRAGRRHRQPQLRRRIDHPRAADHAGARRQSRPGRAGPGSPRPSAPATACRSSRRRPAG